MAALIIIGIIILLAIVPLRIVMEYESSPSITLKVLFARFTLYPTKKQKNAPSPKKEEAPDPKAEPAKSPFAAVERVASELKNLKEILGAFSKITRWLICAESVEVKIRLGSSEADKTAVACGMLWAVGANLRTLLGGLVRVKNYNLNITPDYSQSVFEWKARCILRTNSAKLISAAAIVALRYVFCKKRNKNH